MQDVRNRVCPVEKAGSLDIKFRRWVHNPRKILGPYVKEGMTVLDVGCGPGFFSIDMAHMVGETGRVIAADLQEGMLQKVHAKIRGTPLENRIVLHRCEQDRVGVNETVDFALAFYMVHEIPKKGAFFAEMESLLKPHGHMLIVEPPFHVNGKLFEETLAIAKDAGFDLVERPRMFLDRAACLKRRA